MNAADLIGVLLAIFGVLTGGVLTYMATHRINSGTVRTSDAGEVFEQTRKLLDMLELRADKAEAQRDKLLDSQSSAVAPALAEISRGFDKLADMNRESVVLLKAVLGRLDGKQ